MKMKTNFKKAVLRTIRQGYILPSEIEALFSDDILEIEIIRHKDCLECKKKDLPVYAENDRIILDRENKLKIIQALTTGERLTNLGKMIRTIDHFQACEKCPIYWESEKKFSKER